jgi:ubiquinone/menaquinone biosynthesis C-methylase UbiE
VFLSEGLTLIYDHDRLAGIYDQFTDLISLYQTARSKEYLQEKIDKNKTVLEIGCGNGKLTISCSKKCSSAVGLDISKNMIENAKKNASRENIKNVKFFQEDFFSFQPNEKFDYVILSYFLNVFPNEAAAEKVLKRASTLVKPGGLILIADELEPKNTILSIIINTLRIPVFNFFYITTGLKYHRIHDLNKIMRHSGIQPIEEKRFLFQYCSVIIGKV